MTTKNKDKGLYKKAMKEIVDTLENKSISLEAKHWKLCALLELVDVYEVFDLIKANPKLFAMHQKISNFILSDRHTPCPWCGCGNK